LGNTKNLLLEKRKTSRLGFRFNKIKEGNQAKEIES